MRAVALTVNGARHGVDVEPRDLLVHVLRERLVPLLTNMGGTPLRVLAVEEAVASGASPADAAAHAADGTEPSSDTAATAEFRMHLARVLTKRALAEALA